MIEVSIGARPRTNSNKRCKANSQGASRPKHLICTAVINLKNMASHSWILKRVDGQLKHHLPVFSNHADKRDRCTSLKGQLLHPQLSIHHEKKKTSSKGTSSEKELEKRTTIRKTRTRETNNKHLGIHTFGRGPMECVLPRILR